MSDDGWEVVVEPRRREKRTVAPHLDVGVANGETRTIEGIPADTWWALRTRDREEPYVVCKWFAADRGCDRGPRCPQVHLTPSQVELFTEEAKRRGADLDDGLMRDILTKYKKPIRMCRNADAGCKYGASCAFVHMAPPNTLINIIQTAQLSKVAVDASVFAAAGLVHVLTVHAETGEIV